MTKNEICEIIDQVISTRDRSIHLGHKYPLIPDAMPLDAWRLVTIYSGVRTFRIADGSQIITRTLKCGDVIVKEPFAGLKSVNPENNSLLSVMCWKKQIKMFLQETPDEPIFSFTVPSMKPDDGILLLGAIFQLFPTSGTSVTESLLKAFLYKCREQIVIENTKRQRNPSQHLLYKIACYINENLRAPLSCGLLAQRFKISENYISQLFIRYAGQSFKNYVQTERLQLACFVLRNSNMNIGEIADYCGFSYANYFIRVFKKHYNCTPLEYRMRNI